MLFLLSAISFPSEIVQAQAFPIVYRIPCQVKKKQAFVTLIFLLKQNRYDRGEAVEIKLWQLY